MMETGSREQQLNWSLLLLIVLLGVGIVVPNIVWNQRQPNPQLDEEIVEISQQATKRQPWFDLYTRIGDLERSVDESMRDVAGRRLDAFNQSTKAETALKDWIRSNQISNVDEIADQASGSALLTQLQGSQADAILIQLQLEALESAGPRLAQLRRQILRHAFSQEDDEELLRELKKQVSNLEGQIQLDNPLRQRDAEAKAEQAAALIASELIRRKP